MMILNQPQVHDIQSNSHSFIKADFNTDFGFQSDRNLTPEEQWTPTQLSSSPWSSTKSYDPTSLRPGCFTSSARVRKPGPKRRQVLLRGRSRRQQGAASTDASSGGQRTFTCSFAAYGCQSTFISKNEWKRHVSSKHLQLGFYRCDVGKCNEHAIINSTSTQSSTSPSSSPRNSSHSLGKLNDFNRKDLFTQHHRRMHVPWMQPGMRRVPTDADYEEFEESLEEVRQRCFHELRQVPQQSSCVFCSRTFSGKSSWDTRMEHVGRHFERDDPENLREEAEDVALRDWGLREGILVLKDGGCLLANLIKGTVFSLIIINKAGGLIYQREFQAGLHKLSTNDYLVLAGTFHGVHAITRSITPKIPLVSAVASPSVSSPSTNAPVSSGNSFPNPGVPVSGLEHLETDRFRLTCFQTPTGTKFLLFTDPMTGNVDTIINKIYELYADYVMKNPFYQLEMPVRCESFDRHLGAWLRGRA
ncbi:Sybindin-like family protein [Penicillium taxi]|uniref:Sybindin-like family protein n=1 Tax=Penicillium taxi TaxID=168475 RepID=UPI0025452EF7|nr:Sybindin-like family protein [Penicillium taxi]KAJ5900140.1 Sybindin-like family protein [Penicillium taxi]